VVDCVNIKIWKNLTLDKDAAFALAQEHGLPFFLAMLLQIRGMMNADKDNPSAPRRRIVNIPK
jgi:hypothetical protein